jgi:serine/threonine protein kinase
MAKPDDKIGPYTLVRRLGRGAFGVVWLAEKRTVLATTKVALKFPNDEDVDLDAVKQEAALWIQASGHPNVLTFIDADVYDGQVVIVSEYAPDGSLLKWLEAHGGRAPTVEAAVEMMLGILAGLEHLHKRNIIHRDIKPDNILLQNETPRLADFGIARILKTTSRSTIATGTPAYMAPEAFDGKRNEETDIWSVGAVFYQLLTGHLPFPQTDIPSLLMAIVTKEPEPLPESIPESLSRLVGRALRKSPEERLQSASEMRGALRDAAKSLEFSHGEGRAAASPRSIADLPTRMPGESPPASQNTPSHGPAEAAIGGTGPSPHEPNEAVQQYVKELERKEEEERRRREAEEAERKAEIRRWREQEQRQPAPPLTPPQAPPHTAQPAPPSQPALTYPHQDAPRSKMSAWITLSVLLAVLLGGVLYLGLYRNRNSWASYDSGSSTEQTPSYTADTSMKPTPYPTVSSQPTTAPAPQSVTVRLRLLFVGASHYSAAESIPVTLQSSTQNFTQATDSKGFVTFNGVPCNEEVEINFRADNIDMKLIRIQSHLSCGTPPIDLGIYSVNDGNRLGAIESDLDGEILR